MLIVNDKIFIVAYGSKTLWVTDLNGKIIKSIQDFDGCKTPRKLAASGEYLYIGCYESKTAGKGALVRMNTSDYSMTALESGSTPEQIAISNNKVYMVNCGWGYDNTVSVYDIAGGAFTKLDDIIVNYNPNYISTPNGELYVVCWPVWVEDNGNYVEQGDYIIQVVDTANNNAVSKLNLTFGDKRPNQVEMGKDGILYIMAADGNYPPTADIYSYNTTQSTIKTYI